jgi:uncharacterized delta-60 repeat protein
MTAGSVVVRAVLLSLLSAGRAAGAPGDLDSSFGANGLVLTDVGADDEAIRALALRADGKLLAAGYTVRDGERVVALLRYNRDGTPDATFGTDGVVIHDLGPGADEALAIAIQSDGRLLVGGSAGGAGVVVRLTRTGTLDSTFGAGGIAAATRDPVVSVVRTAGGAVVAGTDNEVVRLTTSGALDTAFGSSGRLTPFGGRALVVLPDGGYAGLGGRSTPPFDFEVWRASFGGELDESFGTDHGKTDVFPNPGQARGFAMLLLPDGRPVAAGYREGENRLATRQIGVGRLRTNGRLDTSFDGDGKLLTDFNGHDTAYALVRQPDGYLVIAGDGCRLMASRTTCPAWTFALARYDLDGTLDPQFGEGGRVTTVFPAAALADAHAFALVQQADGKLVAAGVASSGPASDFALARYQSGAEPTPSRTPSPTPGPPTATRPATGTPTISRTPSATLTRTPSSTSTQTVTRTTTATPTYTPETPPTCAAPTHAPPLPTPCTAGCAGGAVRIADINTTPARCAEAYEPAQFLPAALTRAGNGVYFLFDDCHTGIELWRSDGTAGGTRSVKDIRSGPSGSDIEMLGELDGELVFVADDGVHGHELWRSDGSEAGTVMIADLAPGAAGIMPSASVVAGGTLYFVTGVTLWKSDGTPAGTFALRDFPSNTFSDLTGPASLTAFEDALYFVAPGAAGDSLWRSDGTVAGTGVVRVLGGGGCAGGPMRAGAGALFLRAFTLDAGCELWRSDGTSSGTMLVRDINPGPFGSTPEIHAVLGGRAVFAASTPQTGRELWASDGTAEGTILLGDLETGPASALECDAPGDVVAGGFLFFLADYGRGCELWRTDGTAQGTRLTRELVPGAADAAIEGLTAVGDVALFSASTAGSGREPWRSDGSAAGTVMLAELSPGAGSSLPDGFPFVAVGAAGGIVFAAKDETGASALWRSNGSAAGTVRITDFPATGSRGSDPTGLTATRHGLLFTAAADGERGVFRADAAAPAVARLGSVGTSSAREIEIADLDGVFLYITDAPPALWRTDGASTPAAVREFAAGAILGDPVAIEGAVLFVVSLAGRDELWRSDGTADGTLRVGADLTAASRPVAVGARAFFSAGPPNNIFLLSSDGTASGTRAIVRVGTPISDLTASGGKVFFVAAGFTAAGLPVGRELWVSDGTAAGTMFFDIDSGARSSNPGELVDVDGTLFFAAEGFFVGRELWRSDGTVSGTQLVRDITTGRRSSAPAQLAGAGGRLFFAADDGCSARGLWVSNGSEAGTRRLASVVPVQIGTTGDRAVFAGSEPQSGDELWLSDGTVDGTGRLADIAPGAASSSPRRFTVSGDYLYFTADEGMSGEEVWALRLTDLVLPTPTPSPTGSRPATPSETPTAGPTRTPARCPGDCLGDGVVAISDLITGVNIALERAALDGCANLDRDGNGRVSIDELIGALNSSLGGCPA